MLPLHSSRKPFRGHPRRLTRPPPHPPLSTVEPSPPHREATLSPVNRARAPHCGLPAQLVPHATPQVPPSRLRAQATSLLARPSHPPPRQLHSPLTAAPPQAPPIAYLEEAKTPLLRAGSAPAMDMAQPNAMATANTGTMATTKPIATPAAIR